MWSTIHILGTAILTLMMLIYLCICLPLVDVSFHMAETMSILSAYLHYLVQSLKHTGLTTLDYKFHERGNIFSCVHYCFSPGPSTVNGIKWTFNMCLWNKCMIGSHTEKLVESWVCRSKEFWLHSSMNPN